MGGAPADIIGASVATHAFWHSVKKFKLSVPFRHANDLDFAAYLLRVGGGTQESFEIEGESDLISLPPGVNSVDSLEKLIDCVYGTGSLNTTDLTGAEAILATTNSCIQEINQAVLDRMPGQMISLCATDTLSGAQDGTQGNSEYNYPPEILNAIHASGGPPGMLNLKVGAIIVFIRNVNFFQGMVNGQKARVIEISQRLLRVQLLTPDKPIVNVPRIDFDLQAGPRGVHFGRRQFPITLCFASTFHRCQGQTLTRVGIDLRNQPFTHGMAYVCMSRPQAAHQMTVLSLVSPALIKNVVYQPLAQAARQD